MTFSRVCVFALLLVGGAGSLPSLAAPLPLPTWPQKFDIGGPESATFGFIVTQPGPVAVDLQTSGAPVIATLQGATVAAAQQGGTGNLHLTYQVTQQDLQTNPVWIIRVSVAPPANATGARAGGIVMVRAPAVDPGAAQAQLATASAHAESQRQPAAQTHANPRAAAALAARMDAALNARRAQYDQQRQQVKAQMHAQLQPMAAAAQMRLASQVRSRGLPQESSIKMTAAPPRAVRSTASPPPPPPPTTTAPPATASPAVANSVISSLSISQGQPGDPVMISGSGFGGGGEVHFIINPGRDLVAHVDIWSDTQVFAEVPDASGVLGFNGQAYIVRGADNVRSNLVPFHFNPGVEFRDLRSTTDRLLQPPWTTDYTTPSEIARDNFNPFTGYHGDDVLFNSVQLKNGWVVEDASVYCEYTVPGGMDFCQGGAYPLIVPRGSAAPATTVHWWINVSPFAGESELYYTFAVRIVGPKGIPDGVAVP